MRRGREDLEGLNPWVVIADCTMSLAFILLVFAFLNTLQNSQAMKLLQRKARQSAVRKEVFEALIQLGYGDKTEPYDQQQGLQVLVDSNGNHVAKIYENASYQRICLFVPLFDRGRYDLLPKADTLFQQLGVIVQKHWKMLDYLDLHGIAQPNEASANDLVPLSTARANEVLRVLESSDVVGEKDAEPTTPLPGSEKPTPQIPLKFTVPYGMGSKLYAQIDSFQAGRVDLVLFFKDVGT